jgi:uncharacterized membrane protein
MDFAFLHKPLPTIVHVATGTVVLVSGLISMIAKKGGKAHILAGKLYYFAMLVVLISSLYLALNKGSWFFFYIAVFSFYLLHTGRRYAQLKTHPIAWYDYVVLGASGVCIVAMIASLNPILISFGAIYAFVIAQEVYNLVKLSPAELKKIAIRQHITGMVASYIAATTALLVNNVPSNSPIVWLIPTFILTPLIIYWQRQYARKPKPVAEV